MTDQTQPDMLTRGFGLHTLVFAAALTALIMFTFFFGMPGDYWLFALAWFALLLAHGAYAQKLDASADGMKAFFSGEMKGDVEPLHLDLPAELNAGHKADNDQPGTDYSAYDGGADPSSRSGAAAGLA